MAAFDPRLFQIASLAGLLAYGFFILNFGIALPQAVVLVVVCFLTQYFASRLFHLPRVEWRSAAISALSLCLLLRTNSLALAGLAAFIAIGCKFTLRYHGKHLFNPTNFGLIAAMLLSDDRVWVSPGQWGNAAFFGFLMICLGGLVVNRAMRSDITLAFLAFYLALVFGRSFYLGEPMTIPIHRLESGALLLFAFFMISDPKTTPDRRAGRILFAGLVAGGAWYIQFRLFRTNGLLWSLVFSSLLVPFIDLLFRGPRYVWLRDQEPALQTVSATA